MWNILINYLIGNFEYAVELRTFFMAFQGCMAVRKSRNANSQLNWFYAFSLSLFTAYSGSSFGSLWLAKPSSMLSNDMNFASCILAFVIVNCTPFDIGYKLGQSFPIMVMTTMFAQLFRVNGLVGFTEVAFEAFKDKPSKYYPIPVFGPILYATLLGNMGGFFLKGLDKYLENGMPWPFQSGFLCASFYHFYLHDQNGFIGYYLRQHFYKPDLDDRTYCICVISAFQHVVALLRLPYFLGPQFTPFNVFCKAAAPISKKKKKKPKTKQS